MSTQRQQIRVLVVDDSAFARKVLREALSSNPNIKVVGTASDGLEALEKIAELEPDVVTLDLVMPNLDGVGVLRELRAVGTRARVVVVSFSDQDSELAVQALQLGAVDLVKKPTALATDRLWEMSSQAVEKVLAAAAARPLSSFETAPGRTPDLHGRATKVDMVAIGTSTGGPQALTRLLSALPADFPAAIAIGLHIPGDYTSALAKRLDQDCALDVVEASEGLRLRAGLVVLAKGGAHLTLQRRDHAVFTCVGGDPVASLYYPSIDLLFETAAVAYGTATLGVVLTGMGDDGLLGARAIVKAGGRVLTEAESTCAVYGMPRAVREAGLSAGEARLESMVDEIVRSL